MTHICVGNLSIIGSDNGLSPGRRQAIIWINAGMLLIGPSGTISSENLIKIHTFSFTKMHLEMSPGKWQPSCLGLNVLITKLISETNSRTSRVSRHGRRGFGIQDSRFLFKVLMPQARTSDYTNMSRHGRRGDDLLLFICIGIRLGAVFLLNVD